MKTIKEAANDYAMCYLNCKTECDTFETCDEKQACCNRLERNAHTAGVQFAETWIPVDEELPKDDNEFPFVKYLVLVDIYARNYMCQTETVATFDNGVWKTDRTDPDIERIEVIKWRPINRK